MPIEISCPSCSAQYSLNDSFAGKAAKCRSCRKVFKIPAQMDHRRATTGAKKGQTAGEFGKYGLDGPIDDSPSLFGDTPAKATGGDPLGNHVVQDPGFRQVSPFFRQESNEEAEADEQLELMVNTAIVAPKVAKKKRDPLADYLKDEEINPRRKTKRSKALGVKPKSGTQAYGGIGRLAYFLISLLIGAVFGGALVGAIALFGIEYALPIYMVASVIVIVVGLGLISQRLANMGYHPVWCLGIFVPILNVVIAFGALICPEGYADHKTLDKAGKIIAWIFLGFFALSFLLAVLFVALGMIL